MINGRKLSFTKSTIAIIMLPMLVVITMIFAAVDKIIFAEEQSLFVDIEALCKEFTEDEDLQDGSGHDITQYEAYIDERFEIGNYHAHPGITDEWIFEIIPKQVFDLRHQDFLYIGNRYGFYVDYVQTDDEYFVYLFLNEIEVNKISGHIKQRIRPLFYERYTYDEQTGAASLRYVEDTTIDPSTQRIIERQYYYKYSKVHNVYIKDVAFGGSLFNENHRNFGEEGYFAENDKGGYFIGSSYKFKGVSLQSGKTDFIADIFMTAIGYMPGTGDYVGTAMDILDLSLSALSWHESLKRDFREVLTNENDYSLSITDILSTDQIEKYGALLKNYVTTIATPNDQDALLFGIEGDCYVESTAYYSVATASDIWNTGYAGTVMFDIVEESLGIDDSDVYEIASDVESNDIKQNIFEQEITDLQLNSDSELYAVEGKGNQLRFSAPVNGVYTFETRGDASNIFEDYSKGEMTQNGKNARLEVRLEAGEVFTFRSVNKEEIRSIYEITAKFTPHVMDKGEQYTITVAPGESEFVEICADTPSMYSWSVSGGDSVGVSVMYEFLDVYEFQRITDDRPSGGLIADETGSYYIEIYNDSEQSRDLHITVDEPSVAAINEDTQVRGRFYSVYEVKLPYLSAFCAEISADNSIVAQVYDDDVVKVAEDIGQQISVSGAAGGGRSAYVVLIPSGETEMHCKIVPAPAKLDFGGNTLSQSSVPRLYEISSPYTRVRVDIDAGDIGVAIFDENMNEMQLPILLEQGKRYYVGTEGSEADISLDVTVSVGGSSGVFDQEGFVMIEYAAPRSGSYTVTGTDNYSWYTDKLIAFDSDLEKGETYYLKAVGSPGDSYEIDIEYDSPELTMFANQNIKADYYRFEAESSDTYLIKTKCVTGAEALIDIYDENNEIVASGINAQSEYAVELDAGTYFFDVSVVGAAQTTFRITAMNSESNLITVLHEDGQSTSVDAGAQTLRVFEFTPSKTAEYHLQFASSAENPYEISVYDGETKISATSVQWYGQDDDAMTHRYAVKMGLTANHTYRINVDCYDMAVVSYAIRILVPAKLQTISYGGEIVYQNGSAADNVFCIMGVEKGFTVTYNGDATVKTSQIRISDSANPGDIAAIDGTTLTADLDSAQDGKQLVVIFTDDYSDDITLTLTLKKPYYANSTLSGCDYSVQITDAYGAVVEEDVLDSYTLNYSKDSEWQSVVYEESFADLIELELLDNTIVSGVATLNYEGNTFEDELPDLQYTVTKLLATGGSINLTARVVVITRLDSNSKINAAGSVDLLAFRLSGGSARTGVQINIASDETDQNDKIVLYFENLILKSNVKGTGYIVDSDRSMTEIHVRGTSNQITGYATEALIVTEGVRFYGDGSLEVSGGDGDNGLAGKKGGAVGAAQTGNDGTAGTNGSKGTSALNCTQIKSDGIVTVTLKGGNGGNGGDGGDGGNGGAGSTEINIGGSNLDGGNGGKGGSGGNGGDAGKGCSISFSIAGITAQDGYAGRAGNGGDGGNGGNGNPAYAISYGADYTVRPSSNGGNGGNGGGSGVNGSGNVPGEPASGGKGGNGGRGGDGCGFTYLSDLINSLYVYGDASNGGRGGNGGNGYSGGDGGNGGAGGKGAQGRNGSVFYKVEDGRKGGNGGNGGIGGSALTSDGNVGKGGLGGAGGEGGDPGDPVISSNTANKGASGAAGIDGTDGVKPSSCVATGTLITLADGSQVSVEQLTGDELLLVWDLFAGKFATAPILFIDSEADAVYRIITLEFSDGTSVDVIDEHGFWDVDLNRYVFLREDAAKYIGHRFARHTVGCDGGMTVSETTLEGVSVRYEYTRAWSPVTYGHLCYYVNGMLSMPGATEGLINIFDVDPETMTVDPEKMQEDIQKYGMFTYEEFSMTFDVPKIVFDAFNGKYLKISMGKGLTDEKELSALIAGYGDIFEELAQTE